MTGESTKWTSFDILFMTSVELADHSCQNPCLFIWRMAVTCGAYQTRQVNGPSQSSKYGKKVSCFKSLMPSLLTLVPLNLIKAFLELSSLNRLHLLCQSLTDVKESIAVMQKKCEPHLLKKVWNFIQIFSSPIGSESHFGCRYQWMHLF